MGLRKQSVSFTDTAFDLARELVETGEYPNASAAISGELARVKAGRDRSARSLKPRFGVVWRCPSISGSRSVIWTA